MKQRASLRRNRIKKTAAMMSLALPDKPLGDNSESSVDNSVSSDSNNNDRIIKAKEAIVEAR